MNANDTRTDRQVIDELMGALPAPDREIDERLHDRLVERAARRGAARRLVPDRRQPDRIAVARRDVRRPRADRVRPGGPRRRPRAPGRRHQPADPARRRAGSTTPPRSSTSTSPVTGGGSTCRSTCNSRTGSDARCSRTCARSSTARPRAMPRSRRLQGARPRCARSEPPARRNPLPVVVPCHRVVRSDGSIGQYLGGTETKQALLAMEAAA